MSRRLPGRPFSRRRQRWVGENYPDRGLLKDSDLRATAVPISGPVTVWQETFFAIRLTSGEQIYGEYGWMEASGPDDWTVAEEADHDDPTEYEIVEMTVRSIAKRTFGEIETDNEDEEDLVSPPCTHPLDRREYSTPMNHPGNPSFERCLACGQVLDS